MGINCQHHPMLPFSHVWAMMATFFVIAMFIRLGNLGDFIFSSHQSIPYIISTLSFTMQRCHVILESLAYEKMCILILKPCRWQVECPWLSMTCSSDRCTTPQICPPLSWLRCARSALEAHVTRQSAPRPLVHNKSLASQQCTWNKSQEWRRGAGQSHWSVKSPIAVCPQPACSVFSVHTPYFIFVSHLQMILSVLILINIGALSLIIVKMILILSSAAMPGCMCCKGAAIFSCTNTDLQ